MLERLLKGSRAHRAYTVPTQAVGGSECMTKSSNDHDRLKGRRRVEARANSRLSISVELMSGPTHLRCVSVWLRLSDAAIAAAPSSPILLLPNRRPARLRKKCQGYRSAPRLFKVGRGSARRRDFEKENGIEVAAEFPLGTAHITPL